MAQKLENSKEIQTDETK